MNSATEMLEAVDIVRLLGELISDNDFTHSDRLPPIRELAETFGVKAGAVRDALLTAQAKAQAQAKAKGLMKVLPRVGAIVQSEGNSEDAGSFVVRSFDEFVGQPDARLDVEFHLEIGQLSGNTVITSLLRVLLLEIRPHLNRIRWSDNRRAETNESHARIYSVLVAGDSELTQGEMRDHIRAAYDSLLDEIRQPPAMNGGK
jgi:DNA-binding FadR family transcriptional regulator